jgi:hypothetical protein
MAHPASAFTYKGKYMSKSKTSAKSLAIQQTLIDHQELSLSDVARSQGLSRERVRQIAGDIPGACRKNHEYRACTVCGQRLVHSDSPSLYSVGLCAQHYLLDKESRKHERFVALHTWFTCPECGTAFPALNSRVALCVQRYGHPPVCCSHACRNKRFARARSDSIARHRAEKKKKKNAKGK